MQSQQLLMESQVLKDELLMGVESAEQPAEHMSERHNHGKNNIGTIRIQLFCQVIHFAGVRCFGEAQPKSFESVEKLRHDFICLDYALLCAALDHFWASGGPPGATLVSAVGEGFGVFCSFSGSKIQPPLMTRQMASVL